MKREIDEPTLRKIAVMVSAYPQEDSAAVVEFRTHLMHNPEHISDFADRMVRNHQLRPDWEQHLPELPHDEITMRKMSLQSRKNGAATAGVVPNIEWVPTVNVRSLAKQPPQPEPEGKS